MVDHEGSPGRRLRMPLHCRWSNPGALPRLQVSSRSRAPDALGGLRHMLHDACAMIAPGSVRAWQIISSSIRKDD